MSDRDHRDQLEIQRSPSKNNLQYGARGLEVLCKIDSSQRFKEANLQLQTSLSANDGG